MQLRTAQCCSSHIQLSFDLDYVITSLQYFMGTIYYIVKKKSDF